MTRISCVSACFCMILLRKFIKRFKTIIEYAEYKNIVIWAYQISVLKRSYAINYIGSCDKDRYQCIMNCAHHNKVWLVKTKLDLGWSYDWHTLVVSNIKIAEILALRGLYSKYKKTIQLNYECRKYLETRVLIK